MFGKDKDVPAEVSKAGLGKWYGGLSDQDKIKLGRYLKSADSSSPVRFMISVSDAAIKDENYAFAASVGKDGMSMARTDLEKYDVNEKYLVALYYSCKYTECLEQCDLGLSMVPKLKKELFARAGGDIPGDMMCRNYKLNVLVGVIYDYDGGDKALDEYYEMGLITKEDLEFRKKSNTIFKLQKAFDGIYAVRIKDE